MRSFWRITLRLNNIILRAAISSLVLLYLSYPMINAQDLKANIQTLWRSGQYDLAAQRLLAYKREKRRTISDVEVDFMLAVSLCRTTVSPEARAERKRSLGYELLQLIPKRYRRDLDSESIAKIKREQTLCKVNQKPQPTQISFRYRVPTAASVKGDPKGRLRDISQSFLETRSNVESFLGFMGTAFEDFSVGESESSKDDAFLAMKSRRNDQELLGLSAPEETDNVPIQMAKASTSHQFRRRLFFASDIKSAVGYLRQNLGGHFKVASRGHVVIASSCGQTEPELLKIAQTLNYAFEFFMSKYSMSIEFPLITIYLVPDIEALSNHAALIHGLTFKNNRHHSFITYGFYDDFSISTILPTLVLTDKRLPDVDKTITDDDLLYKLLMPKLFTLMAQRDFGGMPPWMYHGLSAFYENVEISEGNLLVKPLRLKYSAVNLIRKRQSVLQYVNLNEVFLRYEKERPPIEHLLEMEWDDFKKKELASYIALDIAPLFIFYLKDRDKLTEVYTAFRDRSIKEIQDGSIVSDVQLLTSVLKKTVPEINKDFNQWVEQFMP